MIRYKHVLIAALSASLLVSACGSTTANTNSSPDAVGDPVAGGTLAAIQGGEPRSLDPAAMINVWMANGLVGNALYGTLMINNSETLDIEYTMAEAFETNDGGSTFTLILRPGLMFTDGTPLDAEAVKFNWDRLREPATASPSLPQASQVAASKVVNPATLEVTMVAPNPHFAHSLVASAMNWIASPTALAKGQAAFNDAPIGAGPFELVSWQRQSAMELKKNPGYWDAPKPYLDQITLRTVTDTTQRINSIKTGGADIAMEASWSSIADAQDAGFPTETVPTGGGQFIGMNMRRAPFDDERARRAVTLAVDLDAMNTAVYNGKGKIPETLFTEGSPFYTPNALPQSDKATAQELFDELAAAGKPLSFTFLAYSTPENKAVAEALQAQLSTFDNVDAKVEIIDFAAGVPRIAAHEFDMIILSSTIQDPDSSLWNTFHSTSRGNYTGINDRQLDTALDEGRTATTVEARTAAYEIAQQRLIELNPGVWYTRSAPTVVSGKNVQGVEMYTVGSTLPEELWMVK
ncbi:ABC transporter substrate-binding protein [Rhodococcus sp. ACPA4]|jgi:peptide/nickel transport system substrate-binding protein|uniref:ABC transporter substrate-binding protein n=1 Tax=unclassified Rhodococcus (in: high G+C Gram-positive bacteria) TaxID=192944 RepID=UPI0005D370E4|nr:MULTISPECIES: ABC transporter substrate-binding protein [unclassified Rhodococcus (in: high G+C Gram-positive bacteria)]KJF21809.1 Glutathione-binding protein gsiB precursor [Rhodococcus sp. AD45]PBC40312.1 ABC transporter substrate-binding protein [Rhodococcus sp. ACPA4]PSR39524.1 ABC transporter substrate-binding protein [Rhodococcus sp. AD45-ID]